VSELLATLRGALTELAGRDVPALADEEVRSALPELLAAVNQVGAVTAAIVGSFDVRDLSDLDACKTARTWLIAFGRLSQGAASGWLKRGRLLRQLPRLAAAAGQGLVSIEQVELVGALADRVGVEAVVPFDAILAELAATAGPAEVAHGCRRLLAHLDPDGADPDPAGAFERRELTLSRSGSMTYLRGRLDPEGAAAFQTALDALMRPPGSDDLRTPGQRRADALVELARLPLTEGALPSVGGERPHLGVLVTPTMLYSGAGDADRGPTGAVAPCCRPDPDALVQAGVPSLPDLPWMNWVDEVPPELAQRIACDAQVWRAVLDPATGLPLEVGRAHRVVPHWIRRALHARDRGCRWPGCQAPAAWTDAHHLLPWWLGGRTDADNLLLLCRYHHHKVHEGQWKLKVDPTTGEVHVTQPDGRPYELGISRPYSTPNRHPRAA